jgi:diguanylate cyclase (GGDEF)-like protein
MQQDITERKHTESELRVMNTRLQVQLMEIEHLHDQLREEAIRDSLTRLFNRRYMEETLDREISRAERDSFPISVVMMDVDRFKSINDRYGHQAGDAVLQTLGTLLLENTRISDIACRYGGDEMVVVMPGATIEAAANRAREWCAAFSTLEFTLGEVRVKGTLSLGVAGFPAHGRTPNELLGAADKALYQAKSKRNSVEVYDSSMNKHHLLSEKDHS